MNARILGVVIQKDLILYFRNRFFALITILGVVLYIVIYSLMPSDVDESLTLAVYAPTIPSAFLDFLGDNDITIAPVESDEALQQAVIDSKYVAGIVISGEVVSGILSGQETTVTVYFASDAPQEVVNAMRVVLELAFNELSYALNGNPLNVALSEQVIGPDMTGQQIAARNRLLPLLAVMMLVLEMMGLGNLIAEETTAGTMKAILITPLTVRELFAGKAVVGVLLALIQSALLMAFTGSLRSEPVLIMTTLLLSSLVVTGFAFLIASVSRSLMTIFGWSILIIIVMMIPSYGVVFPGGLTDWVRVIPSYYMYDTIHQVVNFGASWSAVASNLVVLLAMGAAVLAAGVFVMERKLR